MHQETCLSRPTAGRTSKEIVRATLSLRDRRRRLRAIFLKLRKFKTFEDLSDIALLTGIINSLKANDLGLSKKETYSAFQLVDKTEYEKQQKRLILKDLLEGAKNRSVLINKNNLYKLNNQFTDHPFVSSRQN